MRTVYEDVITVFDRWERDGRLLWYPTVIEGVHMDAAAAVGAAKYGQKLDGRASVLIPYFRVEGAVTLAGKLYVPPKLWQRVEEPELYVTFTGGERFDFFIAGPWEQPGPVEDEAWPGGFYGHMARERDGVFAVAEVYRYNALPHFEVVGR